MKKYLLILLAIISIFTCIGCSNKKDEDITKYTSYLKCLDTYSSNAKITLKNAKQNVEYNIKQIYSKDEGKYLEVNNERCIWILNDKITIKDLKNSRLYEQQEEIDYAYKLSFVSEYIKRLYTNEVVNYSFEKNNDCDYVLIEVLICDNNRNYDKAILYLNKANSLPEKVIIYDDEGKESVLIEYNEFKGNINIDKEIFNVK